MHAVPLEFSRAEERARSYARTIQRAFLVTVGLHLAGALATNPELILGLLFPRTMIGYPGASRPGALAPDGVPYRPGAGAFRALRLAGPSTLVHLDITTNTPGSTSERLITRARTAGEYEPVATSPRAGSARAGQGSGVQFELDENGSVVSGSGGAGQVAKSKKFQTLKIVRPEYPPAAIRAGLEGLVRLQVEVDTAGKVVGAGTELNTTNSREMEDAAIQAMKLWEFLPYQEKNRPVPFTLIVPFRYRLVD
jgi:TonB family protein